MYETFYRWFERLSDTKKLVLIVASSVTVGTFSQVALDTFARPDPKFAIGESVAAKPAKYASVLYRIASRISGKNDDLRFGTITSFTYKGLPPSDGGSLACTYSFQIKPQDNGPLFDACDYQLSRTPPTTSKRAPQPS